MRFRHWFSIAALVSLLLIFIFLPISDTIAGGSSQSVQGSVGQLYCITGPPPPWWSQDMAYSPDERGICWHGNCQVTTGTASHTFAVTPGVQLSAEVNVQVPGCQSVGLSFNPPEACTLASYDVWGVHYDCIAPDSGQLTVEAHGYGGYTITVTEIEIIEPPVDPPIADPPNPEILAGVQRINQWKAIPYIVYVPTVERAANENAQFIDIWHLDANGVGQALLYISNEQLLALPVTPAENLLIATSPDDIVKVYKLTTGEFQVNIGPLDGGKVYTTIFDTIPPTTVTHSTSVMQ